MILRAETIKNVARYNAKAAHDTGKIWWYRANAGDTIWELGGDREDWRGVNELFTQFFYSDPPARGGGD